MTSFWISDILRFVVEEHTSTANDKNSTLTNKQQCDPEDSKERIIQRTEKPKEAVKKEGTSEVVLDRRRKL